MPRFKMTPWAAPMAIVMVFATSQPARAGVVWTNAAGDQAAMQTDLQDCTEEAQLVGVWIDTSKIPDQPAGGALIATIVAAGIADGLTPKARSDYVKSCMEARQYRPIKLSLQENSEFIDRRTNETAWVTKFYGRADFNQRRAAAFAIDPVAPPSTLSEPLSAGGPLSPAPPEPFTVGAARLDPANLAITQGLVIPGAAILKGPITHRHTGWIAASRGFDGWTLPDGLVVHEVAVNGPDGQNQVYWCGQVSRARWDGSNDHCVWQGPNGARVYFGRDTPWLDHPQFLDDPDEQDGATFAVKESPTDLIGPMTFGLYVRQMSTSKVRLSAEAEFNGKFIDFWTADLPFDAQGRAILPFWSDKLTVTRSGGGVIATLTKDGDGKGWEVVRDITSR